MRTPRKPDEHRLLGQSLRRSFQAPVGTLWAKCYLDDREHERKRASVAAMRSHATQVLAALGGLKALDLNPDHVAAYKKTRRAKKTRLGKLFSDAKV
jgi:hypothetical protein